MDAFIMTILLVASHTQYAAAAEEASKGNSKRKLAEMERTFAEFKAVKALLQVRQ